MMRLLGALIAGCLIGIGLAVSQMMNPDKVLSFIDFFGDWDPTLAMVMIGAIAVAVPGFWLAGKRERPLLEAAFTFPRRKDIDLRLIGGAAIFGLGWGLVGFCPGPALAALSTGATPAFIFVAAMVAGMLAYKAVFPSR
jgi:uncharacterized membrane protein YedE/YeeE